MNRLLHRLRRTPIRWKIVLTMLALALFSVVFVGVGRLLHTRTMFERQLEKQLTLLADVIGLNSTAPLAFHDPAAATETLAALRTDPHVIAAALYDADGKLFAHYQRSENEAEVRLPPVAPPADVWTIEEQQATAVRSITHRGRALGKLTIVADTGEWNEILADFIGITTVLFIAVLIVSFFVAMWMQRLVMGPIIDLAGLARRVARERDFSLRAVKRSDDEVGTLVDGFNEMLHEIDKNRRDIERARDELRQLNEQLEKRVAQRTAELAHTNDVLHIQIAEREQAEERFRAVTETANDAIISADSGGNVIYLNPSAERIFGYAATEVLERPLTMLMPERFHDAHRNGLRRYLTGGEPRVIGKTVELAGRRKDGAEFPVDLSLASWKSGGAVYFTGILRDISARKEIEQTLRNNAAELEAVNRELEAFSYSVSHDLRAPLRSIDGFSRIVLDDCTDKLDAQHVSYLQRVRAATQRMALLIDDLLKLSRVTRVEMTHELVDLSALAQTTVDDLRSAHPERPVEIRIEPGLTADGDPQLLRVTLENLLGNAWKFTGKSEHARIEFGALPDTVPNERTFYVRDNGAGFDMTYADKLFGAFQRLHDMSEFPGSGVGLASVQRVVRRHGGRVWAEAEVGRGATFYFTLLTTDRRTKGKRDGDEKHIAG